MPAEYIATAILAMQLQRPLKWTGCEVKNMVANGHGRASVLTGKWDLTPRAKLLASMRKRFSMPVYPGIGGFLTFYAQLMIQGVYEIPKIRFHALAAATNTTTTVAYRGGVDLKPLSYLNDLWM